MARAAALKRKGAGLALALAASLIAATACADLTDLLALRNDLSAEVGEAPDLKLNDQRLTIIFQNSRFADLPEPDRAKFARRVAELVRDRYAAYGRLETVRVGFASQRSAGIVTLTTNQTPYTFQRTDLAPDSSCLALETAPVTLSGVIAMRSYMRAGDWENAAVLALSSPACVLGATASEPGARARGEIREVQLVTTPSTPPLVEGMQVQVSGALRRAHTGDHHLPVVLAVSRVVPVAQ